MDPTGGGAAKVKAAAQREFFRRTRGDGESSMEYLSAIRLLAAKCDFGDEIEKYVNSQFAFEFPEETPTASILPGPESVEVGEPSTSKAGLTDPGVSGLHLTPCGGTRTKTMTQTDAVTPKVQMMTPKGEPENKMYEKTSGAADGAGESYEIKMLTLVFLRMLETHHEFQLASNMEAAGLFDDIVLRHRKDPDDQWDVSYVQLKHKQNTNKLLSKPDILGISGDFSLVKYCASYESMKSSKELLSFGNFVEHEIIIVTNASLGDSLVDVLECDPLLSTGGKAVSFKAGGEVYQGLREWVDFKEALTELHGQVEGKSSEEVETRIKDALEGVKYSNKAATSWRKELLEFPTLVKLRNLLKKLAPVRDKATYSSFLAKLQVYTNQAHESQLDIKIKEQLAKVWACGDDLEAVAMCHALQSQVKSWWQKEHVYLTQISQLWLGIVKSKLVTLSMSTIEELTKTGAEFESESLRVLHESIPSDGIVNVRVDSRTEASSLRVHQALAKFRADDTVLHVNVQAFLECKDDILWAWKTRWCRVLVLECDKEIEQSEAERISGGILNILGNSGKLLVLIAPASHKMNDLLQGHQSLKYFNDSCKWDNLTNDSEQIILETSTIIIQGAEHKLSELSGEDKERLSEVADLEVISQLLTGLTCGKALPKVGDKFVERRLKSKDGNPFAVNYVRDVEDKVVLVVAEAGMGKSTLMTHLANRAKTEDPKAWIVLIKLNDCSEYLAKMDKDNLNEDAARYFLEHFALNPGNKLEKLIFWSLEDNLFLFLDGVDEVCPDYQQQVFTLLGFIKEFKFTKLWVASRPLSQDLLGVKLGVTALHLDPFSNEEQTAFISNADTDPKEFATLLATLSDKDREMLGVPLIAAMFAEVYQSFNDELVKNGKLDKMFLYENYILKRMRVEFNEKLGVQNSEGVYFKNLMDKRLEEILHNHCLAALRSLFADREILSLKFGNNLNLDENLDSFMKEVTDGKEKTGIIEYVVDGKPVFTHRSLSEYLVAYWLKDNFKENKEFTVKIITTTYAYNLISEMFANLLLSEKHQLHLAVLHRDLIKTKKLLSQPCEVNALDAGGRTALHLAVLLRGTDRHEDFIAIVDTLIQHGARVDIADTIAGWTPLRYAEQVQAWKALDVFLKNGVKSNEAWPKPDTVVMLEAATYASAPVVRYLAEERGGDLLCRGWEGEIMVHRAARGGNVEVLEFLLSASGLLLGHAADVDDTDDNGWTPMHDAARFNKSDVVELLLEQGANPEGRDMNGMTPLHRASRWGSEKVVALLLRHGAEVNVTDNEGRTPLDLATRMNHPDVVKLLTAAGVRYGK